MERREFKALELAAKAKIEQRGRYWYVPSASAPGGYRVDYAATECSCEFFEMNGRPCKHILAVQLVKARNRGNPLPPTEGADAPALPPRPTYKQDWKNYNAAQVNERRHFLRLLSDLCDTIPIPEQRPNPKGGRPALPVQDTLYAACLKVYSLMSARRFSGDLDDAHAAGHIRHVPHFNSVLNVFDRDDATPILRGMIETSALPLRAVETKFAVDSTGFSTQKYQSWFDHKWGVERQEAKWVKAHFATGVATNVVTAVNIDHQSAADCPELPELIHATAKGFTVGEVSADKAYASRTNFDAVEGHGGQFFPAFKNGTTGRVGGAFGKAFHYFQLHREEYLGHYHLRSNVESTVSMVKRKFGEGVRAKNDTAQKNEVYAKFVCHNLCVLIAEMYALGIDPAFGRPEPAAHLPLPLHIYPGPEGG